MANHNNKLQERKKQPKVGFASVKLGTNLLGRSNDSDESKMFEQTHANGDTHFFDDLSLAAPDDDAGRHQYDKIIKFAKRKATESSEAPNKVLNDKIAAARMRLPSDNSRNGAAVSTKKRALGDAPSNSNFHAETSDRVLIKEQIRKRAGKKAVTSAVDVIDAGGDSVCVDTSSFTGMGFARSLLKAVSQLGFATPTPVQAATIPVALTGRDICACAATGTGKTAAYVLPILERIVQNMKVENSDTTAAENTAVERTTRVLILVPTRELAVQVFTVTDKLASHAGEGLSVALAAGGMDIKRQAVELQTRPTIVIATPGRLLDHAKASVLTNAAAPHNNGEQQKYAFTLQNIEVLVLDEADRMLDESFEEQIQEILRLLPPTSSRQTMLFSATMSDDVLALANTLLDKPQKIICNEQAVMSAPNLQQEFLRVRQESSREALLVALVIRHFSKRTLVFVRTKAEAHRIHIILGLLGVDVGELHGNLSQAQRLDTLQRFREERNLDVLVATDVAARGLDIPQVQTIINYRMPNTLKAYVHRVGRTARAGRAGRSVSLVGETERKLLRQVIQASKEPLTSRSVPPEIVAKYRTKLAELDKAIGEILQSENPENVHNVEPKTFGAESTLDTGDVSSDDDEKIQSKESKQVNRKPRKLQKNSAVPLTLFKKKVTRKTKRRAEAKTRGAEHQQQAKSSFAAAKSSSEQKINRGGGKKRTAVAKSNDFSTGLSSSKRQSGKRTDATAFGVDLSRGRQKDY